MNTAQELFTTLQQLPFSERQHFFELLAGKIASDTEQENFSHEEVFGHLQNAQFTATQAAEYLDISIATFRRYVRDKKIVPVTEVGSTHLYALEDLSEMRKALFITGKRANS